MRTITLATRPRRKDQVLKQEAAGTVVLLSLEGGQFYSLEESGGRIWELCDGHRTAAEIAAVIASEYEAPLETIQRDTLELLTDLADEDLVVENP